MKNNELLDRLFKEIEVVILSKQHPVTGLLPASTSINSHGDYTDAWVRDNVYSILSSWCLSMALRRARDEERADQLEQATIKLMRGLLMSMMRQSSKVETFKHTLNEVDGLHAKYDTSTGLEVVADDAWGHLQIDATSIFLLMLAQMSASGLRIVRTLDEVDFVQNLVYYISSAYRTPDFGIWERGNKINNGKTEINASSVGMAKAALQALDGFNLFGKGASPKAVIHSVADSISLARNTLAALLPRESLSKETDSALLSIIGFPAFAVGDKSLLTKTRDTILSKLGGAYGCKRFLWDGHQTALEESSRLYYEHSELANFENIESEWPLFFTYLYIHALFDGNESTAKYYREKIESLTVEVDGFKLLPELYFVPEKSIEQEKMDPGSQKREPNENIPLVWAQSLYLLGLMLDEGLVSRDDLDPLKLRHRSRRYTKTHMALVVLAENDAVKQRLAENGVLAETLQDIQPVRVMSAPSLVDTYTYVGANPSLGLTGRQKRRLQSLATSQTYDVNGKPFLCLSWVQNEHSNYRGYDAAHMAENIKREIAHIHSHWLNQEVAVFTWLVDDRLCNSSDVEVLYQTLRDFQLRTEYEHVGYASAKLAIRASRVNKLLVPDFCVMPFDASHCKNPVEHLFMGDKPLANEIQPLLECLSIEEELTCFRTFEAFLNNHPIQSSIGMGESHMDVRDLVCHLDYQSKIRGYWLLSRYFASVLEQSPNDLADGLMMLAARHLSVVVGKGKVNTIVIDSPMDNSEIVRCIYKLYQHPLERTLVQEFLAIIGTVMRTEPRLFDGLRSIQIQSLMMLCAKATEDTVDLDVLLTLGAMSPNTMVSNVRDILDKQHRAFVQGLNRGLYTKEHKDDSAPAIDTDWFEWRIARGSIARLDDELLLAIWQSLSSAKFLAFGDSSSQEYVMDCDWVRRSMTPGEASFANLIDQHIQQLHPTYLKSAVIEALYAFTQYCEHHSEARFIAPVVFTQVLERAAKSYTWDVSSSELGKRDLDVFLEQPPSILQKYTYQVFEDVAEDPD